MFTGLVQALAKVTAVTPEGPGVWLVVREPAIAAKATVGDSVAVNGCCLTVVAIDGDEIAFQAGEETLSRTNLGELQPGSQVNLESSLRVGDQLGGHYVTGHIDAVGTVDVRRDDAQWSTMWFRVPPQLMRQIANKGSIAVDGVSLTVVNVEPERFSIALIPHTLAMTTLGTRCARDRVNIETDVLAKYVERQLGGLGS